MIKGKNKQLFFHNIFSLMISQVIVKILGLLYRLYLTNRRGFGDEGNAIANGGFQVFALILSIIAIGIPTAIAKIIAETTAKENYIGAFKIFKIAIILFSIFGIIGSYALYKYSYVLANNYLHMKETQLSIIALSPSVFLVSIISVLKGFFSGREAIKNTANAQSLDQLIKTISTFAMIELSIFIFKKTDTVIMAACSNFATTLGNLAELVYLVISYKRDLPIILEEITYSRSNKEFKIVTIVKQILIVAIPISLTALITTISKNIDSITIVNDLKDIIGYEEAKKQYGILSGKVDALVNFPLSFNMAIVTSLLPSIAATNGNIKMQEKRINQSYEIGLIISIPLTMIFFVFSNEILRLLFPNASSGGEILRISSLQIVCVTVEQISNTILNGIGKTIVPIKSIAIGVLLKAILNRILVPKVNFIFGGTTGAAFATLACHFTACLFSTIALFIKSNLRLSIKSIIKPLFASTIMIEVSMHLYNECTNYMDYLSSFIISIIMGLIAFCVLIVWMTPIKFYKMNSKGAKKRRILSKNEV